VLPHNEIHWTVPQQQLVHILDTQILALVELYMLDHFQRNTDVQEVSHPNHYPLVV
jgi:hypothetical protein